MNEAIDKRVYEALKNIRLIAHDNYEIDNLMRLLNALRERKHFCRACIEMIGKDEYVADLLEQHNKNIRDILKV